MRYLSFVKKIRLINFIYLLLTLIAFTSSNDNLPDEVKKSLRSAGNNKKELLKVIDHYKKTRERKKIKAAYFLIGNMQDKYTRTSPYTEKIFKIGYITDSLKLTGYNTDGIDSVIAAYLKTLPIEDFEQNQKKVPDLTTITSEFLIKNIDLAFESWKMPWAKHLNFKDFCEYLLPYRVNDEPLSNWREQFSGLLMHYKDSLTNDSDPKELAMLLSWHLYRRWKHSWDFDKYYIFPSATDLYDYRIGMCDQRYFLMVSILRSMGIASAIDFTPQWHNWHAGHSWISIIDKDGSKAFNGAEDNARFMEKNLAPVGGTARTTIVMRHFFKAVNTDPPKVNISPLFTNKYILNVTDEYEYPQCDFTFNFENKDEADYLMLCCFNYAFSLNALNLQEVKSKKAVIKHLGAPAVYVPVTIKNGKQKFFSPRFFNENGKIEEYKINLADVQDVTLFRKYPSTDDFKSYAKGMKGARIQICNNADFTNAVDVYTITDEPLHFVSKEMDFEASFRYIRYIGYDTSDTRVAEIQVFDENNIQYTGTAFAKINGKDKFTTVPEYAFDNDIRTNFNARKGSWVAMDLGESAMRKIKKIKYLPRNNMNVIEIGNEYELFFLDNENSWQSVGKQVAQDNYVIFGNVPRNSLMVLRNLTQGKQERIFRYENEKQVFW